MSKRGLPSASNGGEHDRLLRTQFTQSFYIAVQIDDWEERTILLNPGNIRQALLNDVSGISKFRYDSSKHILQIALEWKQQAINCQRFSSSYIAAQVGLSSGRIRQILRLTNLHPDVQNGILNHVESEGKHAFPERLVRQILKAPKAQQMQQFEQYVQADTSPLK